MTTLIGNELYEYISILQEQLGDDNRQSSGPHYTLNEVLEAEKLFLKQYHSSNGFQPSLAFSGNGLPSVDSLKPDLEKMSELFDKNELFDTVSSKFRNEIEDVDIQKYERVSRKEFDRRLNKLKKEKIRKKSVFSLRETEDRDLELKTREETYINSIDEDSQITPIMIQDNTASYKVSFGKLMDHSEEDFFSLRENALVSQPALMRKINTKALANVGLGLGAVVFGIPALLASFPFVTPLYIAAFGSDDDDARLLVAFAGITGVSYAFLSQTNPNYLIPLAITQVSTNLASLLYLGYRHESDRLKLIEEENNQKLIENKNADTRN